MTREEAQAGNRASRTGRILQWGENASECNVATSERRNGCHCMPFCGLSGVTSSSMAHQGFEKNTCKNMFSKSKTQSSMFKHVKNRCSRFLMYQAWPRVRRLHTFVDNEDRSRFFFFRSGPSVAMYSELKNMCKFSGSGNPTTWFAVNCENTRVRFAELPTVARAVLDV